MATITVRKGARGVTYKVEVRMAGQRPITKSFKKTICGQVLGNRP